MPRSGGENGEAFGGLSYRRAFTLAWAWGVGLMVERKGLTTYIRYLTSCEFKQIPLLTSGALTVRIFRCRN